MKTISVLLGLCAMLVAELVFANATATTVSGTVQVALGAGVARPLRQGDIVRQGETVTTAAGSSVVLRFDDGQIAALTAGSQMTISTYNFDRSSGRGNVLLSLVSGGMRAITGLIGRNSPQTVSYKAATATIGIRGTDVTLATAFGDVTVSVTDGVISFSIGTQTISVPAGQGVNAKTDGTFQQAAAAQIAQQLQQTPAGQAILNSINGLQGLQSAISQAASTSSSSSSQQQQGDQQNTGSSTGTPGPSGPSGGAGGGTASGR